jgi:hypothetical protein
MGSGVQWQISGLENKRSCGEKDAASTAAPSPRKFVATHRYTSRNFGNVISGVTSSKVTSTAKPQASASFSQPTT